jgi:hypothetical protein
MFGEKLDKKKYRLSVFCPLHTPNHSIALPCKISSEINTLRGDLITYDCANYFRFAREDVDSLRVPKWNLPVFYKRCVYFLRNLFARIYRRATQRAIHFFREE